MSRSTLCAIFVAALPLLLYPIVLFAGTGGTNPKPAAAAKHRPRENASLQSTAAVATNPQ